MIRSGENDKSVWGEGSSRLLQETVAVDDSWQRASGEPSQLLPVRSNLPSTGKTLISAHLIPGRLWHRCVVHRLTPRSASSIELIADYRSTLKPPQV